MFEAALWPRLYYVTAPARICQGKANQPGVVSVVSSRFPRTSTTPQRRRASSSPAIYVYILFAYSFIRAARVHISTRDIRSPSRRQFLGTYSNNRHNSPKQDAQIFLIFKNSPFPAISPKPLPRTKLSDFSEPRNQPKVIKTANFHHFLEQN